MADDEPALKYTLKVKVKNQETIRPDGSRNFSGHGKAQYITQGDPPKEGDRYEGQFVEGCRQGKGVYIFTKTPAGGDEPKESDVYTGHYEENRKHDFGMMKYKEGPYPEEETKDQADVEKWPPRGGLYLGNYFKGLRGCSYDANPNEQTSEGTFHYQNGDIYVGQWRAGKKHGTGTYTYKKDDTKLVGEWEEGKIQNGQWVFPNGTFYSGQFRYNKPWNQGVWVFKNGNQATGSFVQKPKGEEEPPADENAPKPDPKVWCYFKHDKVTAVQGGTMLKPRLGQI